jgi:hypothetical protein
LLPSHFDIEHFDIVDLLHDLIVRCLAIGDARHEAPLDDVRKRNWDAVQIIVDFEAAQARMGSTVDAELLWHLRARGGDRQRDQRAGAPTDARQLWWIVSAFRTTWPTVPRPSGVTVGDKNPWDASNYLLSLMTRLADDTSDEAVAAIEALRDAPQDGYTYTLRALEAEQRQKLVEQAYTPPMLQQISAIVDAGPPVDAADLQAVVLDDLSILQSQLRGSDVDWYRGFFREDGRHQDEERCRDELIKMLRGIDNGLEYIPESHVADDKRVDIVVRANETLILPIEVKGQWHPQLWSAADQQLHHLYVNDWRAERGIYLVLWFGNDVPLTKSPSGAAMPSSTSELREALISTSRAARSGLVDVVVVDFSRPTAP